MGKFYERVKTETRVGTLNETGYPTIAYSVFV